MIIDNAIVIEETDITAALGGHIYAVFNITIAVDTDQGPYQVQTFSIRDAFSRAKEAKPKYEASFISRASTTNHLNWWTTC